MATSLTYAFNRQELLDLIKTPNCDLVVFSLVNLIKPRKTEAYMYIFAEAYSGDEPMLAAQGKIGCPTPPGWSGDIPPSAVDRSLLSGQVPQFAIEQSEIFTLVDENDYVLNNMNQFIVHLEAENKGEGMEPFISLTCLKADSTVKIESKKATHFTGNQPPTSLKVSA